MEAAAVAAAQQLDVGGSGTVRKCADTHAFERHRRTDIRIFVLGRGWRDDDSIVVVGSDGVAHGDVHRGWQRRTKLNLLLLFIYLPLRRL